MSVGRSMATATLLSDGKVLVAGGYDGQHELASAEVYDPGHAWSLTGSLTDARDSATATTLPDGEVLVAGGDGGNGEALASAEIYDPAGDAWHSAASMAGTRQSAAATLLTDGTVLVAGGEDSHVDPADGLAKQVTLDTAERYDPDANTWSSAGAMTTARQAHTLTALDDGRALVVGGNTDRFGRLGLASVERYSPVSTTVAVGAFGSRAVGTSSDVVDAVVTNTGDAPLVVGDVTPAGQKADFAIADGTDSCSHATVAAGSPATSASCSRRRPAARAAPR